MTDKKIESSDNREICSQRLKDESLIEYMLRRSELHNDSRPTEIGNKASEYRFTLLALIDEAKEIRRTSKSALERAEEESYFVPTSLAELSLAYAERVLVDLKLALALAEPDAWLASKRIAHANAYLEACRGYLETTLHMLETREKQKSCVSWAELNDF
ncbi:MAG: hypothetical protein KKH33_12815 [Alphaproteobacteria bacterium]|nr:hypothetical protein [Alphaproteobacteria bacterium]